MSSSPAATRKEPARSNPEVRTPEPQQSVQEPEVELAVPAASSPPNDNNNAAQAVPGPRGAGGQGFPEPEFDHLEKAAEDLITTWTAEEDEKSNRQAAVERGGVPMNHEDAKRWFYKDPQGDLQGAIIALGFSF